MHSYFDRMSAGYSRVSAVSAPRNCESSIGLQLHLHRTPDHYIAQSGRHSAASGKGDRRSQERKYWGFPTGSSLPYPITNVMRAEPPVSSPIYLGKFDFAKMNTK